MTPWRWCLGGLLALVLAVGSASAQDRLRDAFKQYSPAVGALFAQRADGSLNFNCTVTAVDRHEGSLVLLTAFHCVTKDVAYVVTFNGRRFYSARVWQVPKEEVDPEKHRRPYGQPKTDMALFLMDGEPSIPPVRLGTSTGVDPGQRVLVIGFPMGITKIRYEGLIAGRLERPGSDQDGYLILQSFGAPGSSGTAVIEEEGGTVIGVLVSAAQAASGLPVIFVTPIDYRRHLTEVDPRPRPD